MIIDRDISKFIVSVEDSILHALRKITQAKSMIIFAVDQHGVLQGLFTNGDFMRWVSQQEQVNLDQPIDVLLNRHFTYALLDDAPEKIETHLKTLFYVPLVDARMHLVAVARRREQHVQIGPFRIADDQPTFIIAEIGNNHNGSLDLAKQLIDLAVEAGADCAKFQMRDLESLYVNAGNPDDSKENLGSQYTLDLLSRFQLSPDEMFAAFDYCQQRGILPLCTPWDLISLRRLEDYGMIAYKVASADLTNHELLEALTRTGKPLICSTGMSTEAEIRESVQLLQRHGAQYALLHCNSTYPAPFEDIHLRYIPRLKEIAGAPVGYSGHERGFHVAVAAVTLGARIVEKHFTVDRDMEGNDHKVSLLPDEFKQMVEGIRQVEKALGSMDPRQMSQGEIINRVTLAKSLIITQDLPKGEIITDSMIEVKSPGRGLQPNYRARLVGRRAKRDLKKGDFFYPSDLLDGTVTARRYNFDRAWGIPVRYHDFKQMMAHTNPALLEFHLSYKDMVQHVEDYLDRPYDLDLVVHSPELFAGDHLMNLCSDDPAYHQRSIDELQRVADITRHLKTYFTRADRPPIIINAGGFTKDGFILPSERKRRYEQIAESIAQVDTSGVEIIPQTYPPFPWLFGGQFYHNLFLDADDIVDFCQTYGFRICFDVSHSKLACNHFGWSFKAFVDQVAPYTRHLHIADSREQAGEGLQIGEGDIDMVALADQLDRLAPQATFIPEIWQGHENGGEGFWLALDRLERIFKRVQTNEPKTNTNTR
jgi:N-acetylneuraminate synthase